MTFCPSRLVPRALLGAMLIALRSQGGAAASQLGAEVHSADAPMIDGRQQRDHCNAQLAALKKTSNHGAGAADRAFMKTCLADVAPAAVLPAPAAVMDAPVGSTGVCKDGTYASAVRKDLACNGHGGLARWFSQ